MENYSVIENGKTVYKKRPVRNIGPLSRFDDGQPEFLTRLRQSFKEGNPIIGGLDDLVASKPPQEDITIKFNRSDAESCACQPRNIGYFVLDALYDALGIYDVLTQHKSNSGLEYDLNGLAKLLVFGRVLSPGSKKSTYLGRDDYALSICRSEKLIEVYRVLDCLDLVAETMQRRMNSKVKKGIGRNAELCYYDVTNYYFATDYNDSDILNGLRQIINNGLKKKEKKKKKRNKPIVQMGLFIDDNGIPIAYRLFPGNNNDQVTLRPILEGVVDGMKLGRVIVVADGGLNGGPNIAALLDRGDGYVLAKSVKKSDKSVKAWVLNCDGYTLNESGTFKHKSMLRTRKIKDAEGNERKITEKLICCWSKKRFEKEQHDGLKIIELLNAAVANPSKNGGKQASIDKFLERHQVDKDTGEILDPKTILSIDKDKLQEFFDLMGYYTIMTSELTKDDQEVINKYKGLSRIEDSFRVSKSTLEGRPIFVRTPEHINAHFLVCFIALTMIRVIQYRVLRYQQKNTLNQDAWESGITAETIQKSLNSWNADMLPNGYYRLTIPDENLQSLLGSFAVDSDLRLPAATELRQLKYCFDKAVFM
jgi:transposase